MSSGNGRLGTGGGLSPGDIVAGPSRTRTSRPPSRPVASSSKPATPAQTRTLKQPMTLRVAESSNQNVGAQDKEEYFRALKRKADLARRVDKWMDKLMEETVDRTQFQKALSYMHAGQYGEVEHERHLNGLCSYPLCENAPSAPYRAHKRFQINSRARSIKEVEGNADEGFCSKRCRVKSQWVRENLGSEAAWLRGKVAPLDLIDDMEDRGELVWEGGKNGQYRRMKPSSTEGIAADNGTSPHIVGVDEKRRASETPMAVDGETSSATSTQPGGTGSERPPQSASDKSTEIDMDGDATRSAGNAALPRDRDDKVSDVSASSRLPTSTSQQIDSPRHIPGMQPSLATSATSATSAARTQPPSVGAGSGSGTPSAGTGGTAGTASSIAAPTTTTTTTTTTTSSAADASDSDVHALLDSLVIREHDTKDDVPVPPTLNPPPEQLVPKPPSASAARKARNTSSMIDGANSKLAQSVLTAHRQMKPVLQEEGSDGEDDEYQEQEWEKEMGWGEGAELDAMFEEARKARELAGDS